MAGCLHEIVTVAHYLKKQRPGCVNESWELERKNAIHLKRM